MPNRSKNTFKAVPAEAGTTKNCVIVPDTASEMSGKEIMDAAIDNDAFIDGSDSKSFCIQFPQHGQEMLDSNQLMDRFREYIKYVIANS